MTRAFRILPSYLAFFNEHPEVDDGLCEYLGISCLYLYEVVLGLQLVLMVEILTAR